MTVNRVFLLLLERGVIYKKIKTNPFVTKNPPENLYFGVKKA